MSNKNYVTYDDAGVITSMVSEPAKIVDARVATGEQILVLGEFENPANCKVDLETMTLIAIDPLPEQPRRLIRT